MRSLVSGDVRHELSDFALELAQQAFFGRVSLQVQAARQDYQWYILSFNVSFWQRALLHKR